MSDRVCPSCSGSGRNHLGLGSCPLCRGGGFVPTPELSRPEPEVEAATVVHVEFLPLTGQDLYLMSDGTVRWRR